MGQVSIRETNASEPAGTKNATAKSKSQSKTTKRATNSAFFCIFVVNILENGKKINSFRLGDEKNALS